MPVASYDAVTDRHHNTWHRSVLLEATMNRKITISRLLFCVKLLGDYNFQQRPPQVTIPVHRIS